jgi:hypothetical protein
LPCERHVPGVQSHGRAAALKTWKSKRFFDVKVRLIWEVHVGFVRISILSSLASQSKGSYEQPLSRIVQTIKPHKDHSRYSSVVASHRLRIGRANEIYEQITTNIVFTKNRFTGSNTCSVGDRTLFETSTARLERKGQTLISHTPCQSPIVNCCSFEFAGDSLDGHYKRYHISSV